MSNYRPPAIPPIQNIADKHTKDVLLALSEGWQVRNGMTGSGENRFVTKSEFDATMKNLLPASNDAELAQPGMVVPVSGSGSQSGACPDLLMSNNTWKGFNVWERPTPPNTVSDNRHMLFSRDGDARIAFRLGHANSGYSYTDANNDSNSPDSIGNLYLTDPGRQGDVGGVVAILYPPAKGNGMRLFGRLSFDETQLDKVMIRLRDTQKIGWGISGTLAHTGVSNVTSFFDPANSLWVLNNEGVNRFAVDVRANQPDCIRITGYTSNETYLANHMTVNAVYTSPGGVPEVPTGTWKNSLSSISRVPLQAIISDLASTSVDHGVVLNPVANTLQNHALSWDTDNRYPLQMLIDNLANRSLDYGNSINNIRSLSGESFTTGTPCALAIKLSAFSAEGTVSATKVPVLQFGYYDSLQNRWDSLVATITDIGIRINDHEARLDAHGI